MIENNVLTQRYTLWAIREYQFRSYRCEVGK